MAQLSEEMEMIISAIGALQDDTTLSRNIRLRLQEVFDILSNSEEEPIKINKALDKIETLSDDSNIESYARTQILNLASMLESIP